MLNYQEDGQACLFDPGIFAGKTCRAPFQAGHPREKTSGLFSRKSSELISVPFMSLDLTPGAGNLLDEYYWEILSPWRGGASILNTGLAPRKEENVYSLSQILEEQPLPKYYLTKKACLGILRRSEERGKELPPQLKLALETQAGLRRMGSVSPSMRDRKRKNTNEKGIGKEETKPQSEPVSLSEEVVADAKLVGYDPHAGAISGEVSPTLGINCGMSTGRNGILKLMAFTQNQRDEVRDLNEIAGALCTSPGTKQQTYVAGVVSKGDGTCFLTEDTHTSLTGGGGQAGQGYPCVLTYDPPELQDSSSILCLNDQGGQFMNISEGVTGTLRSQMAGHPPLVLESNQDHAVVRDDGISPTLPAAMGMGGGYVPMVYENHGIDSRYTGPYDVSPTISARCGTGGNNLPLVDQPEETFCIVGYVIDRQPENGGNGCGYQRDLAYTLTGMDRHAVYSRQRTDIFKENDVVSTESARQHKDATDLVMQPYQQTVGTIGYSDHHGINNQYVGEDKCVIEGPNLIRRLTPLECERLQGFPDYWTDIPGASDSARYKALGNSVAIPCVDFVMNGMAVVLRHLRAA